MIDQHDQYCRREVKDRLIAEFKARNMTLESLAEIFSAQWGITKKKALASIKSLARHGILAPHGVDSENLKKVELRRIASICNFLNIGVEDELIRSLGSTYPKFTEMYASIADGGVNQFTYSRLLGRVRDAYRGQLERYIGDRISEFGASTSKERRAEMIQQLEATLTKLSSEDFKIDL